MNLPKPIARLGEPVTVLNYRRRAANGRDKWEPGVVTAVTYTERWTRGFSISYEVRLDRVGPSGYPIDLNTQSVRRSR